MFSIYNGESVDIKPVLPERRPVKDSLIQTEYQPSEVISCQIPERVNKQVQVDVPVKKVVNSVEFDPEALIEFLNRVTPEVCSYLESNCENDPFYRYKLLSDVDTTSTYILHSLKNNTQKDEFFCADFSWNSVGSALAVAYSSKGHTDWCEHDMAVAIWNLQRKDFSPEKPNLIIETDSCMTSIVFHPKLPALLAGAKYNGQIFVWNIAKDDDLFMASTESILHAHREPVTGLFWSSESKSKLISCSLDGKILIWKYLEKQNKLELKDGFIVLAENLARSLGIRSVRPDAEVGVTSMSINCEDPSIFIIGTEGGGIFQCSFNAQRTVTLSENYSIPLKSPITVTFEKHGGHVNSIQFSPFLRNVFLSASTDGEIRIYNILQGKPISKIHLEVGIECAQWSFIRPVVIGAVTSDGQLQIFDLSVSKFNPTESFSLAEGEATGTNILFSAKNPSLLCTGLSCGTVQVWMLSSYLTSAESYELEHFKALTLVE